MFFNTDGIQAVQLEDGSTAYFATNMYGEGNNVNSASLNMDSFAQHVSSPSVTVWVGKQFEFVISSVNNLKTAMHKIVNQSENCYWWDNYTDC